MPVANPFSSNIPLFLDSDRKQLYGGAFSMGDVLVLRVA